MRDRKCFGFGYTKAAGETREQGWTKVTVDAAFTNRVLAFAMVVRDHIGDVLWLNSKIGVSTSPLHAEAQAL